ncbi:MAG: Serine/threonine protein kinase, partial [Nocardioides sp.]|nr:Serine/threonine protein kinase [Nocardioides sp.]
MALPQVGQVFGRYRIDDVIGRGGMGVVLGATDTGLGRRVALKVVAADLGGTEEFRARFEREAATLARLDSPHVIAIYDYGTQDDCPYIATQYVAGGDLGSLLHSRGAMRAADALRVCAQVADALDDAHRAGIVHRDVKPTNVLVRDPDADEPHVYLCDFGIARTGTDGLTAPGAVAGTWSYLAPENGRGAPATASSDVYALGCLLWAALTGHPPYRGTDVEIALAHQRDPVPRVPGSSSLVRAVNEVVGRSMAKDAADRFPDAAAMRTALLAAADLPGADAVLPVEVSDPTVPPHTGVRPASPAPVGPPPPRPPSYPSQPSQPAPAGRRRGRLVVAAVAVLALVGAGAAAVVVGTGDDEPDDLATSAAPTPDPTGDPTCDPTGDPTGEPTGPVVGDLDGDDLGDLSFDYDP